MQGTVTSIKMHALAHLSPRYVLPGQNGEGE